MDAYLGIQINSELKEDLEKLAVKENRSMSYVVREILQNHVNRKVKKDGK